MIINNASSINLQQKVKEHKNKAAIPSVTDTKTAVNTNTHSYPPNYYINALTFKGDNASDKVNEIFNRLSNPDCDSSILNTLDTLNTKEKRQFVKKYQEITGFPNLKKVSATIEQHAKESIEKAAKECGVKVLMSGYNNTCSVGKGKALPGSDIDGWFSVVDGNEQQKWDVYNKLKENVNPLILSVLHTRTDDLPEVITKEELFKSLNETQQAFDNTPELQSSDSEAKYNSKLNTLYEDWTKAGEFNIELAKKVPDSAKTPMLRAGFVVEVLRDGKMFINDFNHDDDHMIKNSCMYKYSNSQQIKMHQHTVKEKHLQREKLLEGFEHKNADEQFDIVKSVIQMSFRDVRNSVKDEHNIMFKNHGCGNMSDLMRKLLSKEHGGE